MADEKDQVNAWGRDEGEPQAGEGASEGAAGKRARVKTSADFHKRRVEKKPREPKQKTADQVADEERQARYAARAASRRAAAQNTGAQNAYAQRGERRAEAAGNTASRQRVIRTAEAQVERAQDERTQQRMATGAASETASQQQRPSATGAAGQQQRPSAAGAAGSQQRPSAAGAAGSQQRSNTSEMAHQQDAFARGATGRNVAVPNIPDMDESYGQVIQPIDTRRKSDKRISPARIALTLIALILAIVMVGCGIFSWNRWLRYNDEADFEGQWYVYGTNTPVLIENEHIRIKDDVSYRYTLDTIDKKVMFTFGGVKGQGRYWFTLDRSCLVIEDGQGFTIVDTFVADLLLTLQDLTASLTGQGYVLPSGDNYTVLSRVPNAGTARVSVSSGSASSAASGSGQSPDQGGQASGESASSQAASSDAAQPADAGAASGEGGQPVVTNAAGELALSMVVADAPAAGGAGEGAGGGTPEGSGEANGQ